VSPAPALGVAMLGYGFMGRAHSRALRALPDLSPALVPELISISGRNREALEEARARYGWREAVTDWREQVADERVGLFVDGGPNALHAEPVIAAAAAGKHVLCEKPLGRDAEESQRMWRAAEDAGVVHVCGFNYRFVPAVRRAWELVREGALGEIVHFRARYLQSWGWDRPSGIWRFDRAQAGSGALGDLGAHIVDLARHLVGEVRAVSAEVRTYVEGHSVDDAFVAAVEFENGAIGTLEASRLARGRINENAFELNGSRGSLAFDLERFGELQVSDGGAFRRELVGGDWWPPGHPLGWGDTFTLEHRELVRAIAEGGPVEPAATFEDGYRCAEVCDAILRSAAAGTREPVRLQAGRGRPAGS
jgi:predicted dehydrogenase